jgi:hypothetical protein
MRTPRDRLVGLWFHSHEEDSGGRRVYRDRTHELPRSRAPRRSLAIEEDGTAWFGGTGPADKTASAPGTWELSDDVLTLRASGTTEAWDIESLEEGRLTLRPRPAEEEENG